MASQSKQAASNPKGQKLVIVESPTKARTISRFLGDDFKVIASMGHVRDLPSWKVAVRAENDFEPEYEITKTAKPIVSTIKSAAKNASDIFLATDPDREGEAIAWHLLEAAEITKPVQRVVFHSITENSVSDAFDHPRQIDMRLVNAQFARRHIDRLIGYPTSSLLRKYVQTGSSAGRVQSPALRMVVEREKEILEFIPHEYWVINANFSTHDSKTFTASLARINGKAIPRPGIPAEEQVNKIKLDLSNGEYKVFSLNEKPSKQSPAAPFITTSLQREASNKLRFDPDRTMRIAQQLYEGIDLGRQGAVGLITYMRTDSPQVDQSAIKETRAYIKSRWGEEYLPNTARIHTNKKSQAVAAQEAHEAIRPTSVKRSPDELRQYLKFDQARLYELIWNRMVASQMADELGVTATVEILASSDSQTPYLFRKSGYTVKFPGFSTLYREDTSEFSDEEGNADTQERFPALTLNQELSCTGFDPKQSFTKPPARFTQASLIKALEENGIGRPSTYASTLSTIIKRNQVAINDRKLSPTPLGKAICSQLTNHLSNLVDYEFTARLEGDLDEIANGDSEYLEIMRRFYTPFNESLENAKESIQRISLTEETDRFCPEGHPMVRRFGRTGYFIACSQYPEHSYIESEEGPTNIDTGVMCRNSGCGGSIVEKKSKRGSLFWACNNYPKCKFTISMRPVQDPCPVCEGIMAEGTHGPECIGDCVIKNAVTCPKDGCTGVLLQRRGRFGPFWGCNNYPSCKTIVNKLPLKMTCPVCSGLTISGPKGIPQCYDKECGWKDEAAGKIASGV